MKDKFLFLDLLGNIDDSFIEQSFLPWDKKREPFFQKYHTKIACAILAVLLAGGCIFHTEVEAALRKVTTFISEMLGIKEDISSYTEIKNIPVTKNGLTLTLEEVILNKEELLILVSQKFEDDTEDMDTELLENVKINGKKADILKNYITDATLYKPTQKYVLEYYLNESTEASVPLKIEATFTVKRVDNGDEIGKYRFDFHASGEELEKNTVRIPVTHSIVLSNGSELELQTFTWNPVESTIVAKCNNLPLGNEYYLKGEDDCGNSITYRLLSYENPKMVFTNEKNSFISPNASHIKLQLYRHSLGELISSSENEEFIIEDFLDKNVSKMDKISKRFAINIK